MKSDKTFKQKIHDFWYIEPEDIDKNKYIYDGEFYEITYEIDKKYAIEKAKQQQRENRLKVIGPLLVLILVPLFYIAFFPVLICVGLFFGLVGKLLK